MSCILCQQTLRGELESQEERGKTLLYSHKEASGGWQKRTRKLPCYTRCAYRHKNAEAFLNKGGKGTRAGVATGKLLKVSCNADGIGYEWKPNELYLISNSCIITAFMQKEGDKSDY